VCNKGFAVETFQLQTSTKSAKKSNVARDVESRGPAAGGEESREMRGCGSLHSYCGLARTPRVLAWLGRAHWQRCPVSEADRGHRVGRRMGGAEMVVPSCCSICVWCLRLAGSASVWGVGLSLASFVCWVVADGGRSRRGWTQGAVRQQTYGDGGGARRSSMHCHIFQRRRAGGGGQDLGSRNGR